MLDEPMKRMASAGGGDFRSASSKARIASSHWLAGGLGGLVATGPASQPRRHARLMMAAARRMGLGAGYLMGFLLPAPAPARKEKPWLLRIVCMLVADGTPDRARARARRK